MTLLTRYILLEVFKVFTVALTALTLIMLVFLVFQQARREELSPLVVAQLVPFLIPESLRYSVPAMALLAVTAVFGRMSASQEITALKSLGISPLTIFMPVWLAAGLVSLAQVGINDLAASWGRPGVRHTVVAAIEEVLYTQLATHRAFKSRQFFIAVTEVRGRTLINPLVTFDPGHGRPSVKVEAAEATLHFDADQGQLTFSIYDGTASSGGFSYHFDHEERSAQFGPSSESNSPGWLALRELPREKREHQQELARFKEQLAAQLTYDLITGHREQLKPQAWKEEFGRLKTFHERLARLGTEPYRRVSDAFCTLFFVSVGMPLAVLLRNRDLVSTFFLAFSPILVVYYPLLSTTALWAKTGALPGWGIWGGNLFLGLVGAYLSYRVWRY